MTILSFADLHLRGTVPSCVDATLSEWMEIQNKALDKVVEIAVRQKVAAVYVGGDIFHSERSATFECIIMFLKFVAALKSYGIPVYIMAGNHDLIGHSSENLDKCAIGVLFNSNTILNMADSPDIKGCNFDEDNYKGFKFIFKHVLCIPDEMRPPMVECNSPQSLLENYPDAKIIFTGDYHKAFLYKSQDGRMVMNSGCLTKQASDFENYETGVFVTDLEKMDSIWEPVDIPQKFVKNGGKSSGDKSMEDFVNSIQKESVTLDFVLELKEKVVKQEKAVQNKVEDWVERIGQ